MCILSQKTFSQNWQWAATAGSSQSDKGNDLDIDAAGNLYVGGYYNVGQPAFLTVNFGSITPPGTWGKEGFLAKISPTGIWTWVNAAIGGWDERVIGICVDKINGYVYATGCTWLNVNSFGTCSVSGGSADQIFVGKFDLNGNCLWLIHCGSSGDDNAWDLTTDKFGDIYITGFLGDHYGNQGDPGIFGSIVVPMSPGQDSTSFVAKLSPAGVFQWVKTFDAIDGERDNRIAVDSLSNVYVAGGFWGTKSFGSTVVTSHGGVDIFVVKYDNNGNQLWVKTTGSTLDDRANDITVDQYNDLYVTGEFRDNVPFGSDTINNHGGPNGRDIFVAKMKTNGSWVWAKRAGSSSGGDRGNRIVSNTKGDLFVTGQFSDTAYFGGNITLNNTDLLQVFVASIDTSGTWKWALQGGGIGDDRGNGLACYDSCFIYVCGYYPNNAHFGNVVLNGQGNKDIFVASINNSMVAVTATDTSICAGSSTSLHLSGGSSFLWSPAAGLSCTTCQNPIASPTETTTYRAIVSSSCSIDTVYITISVLSLPVVITGVSDICIGSTTALNVTAGTSYLWSPSIGLSATNIANPFANPTVTTTYHVTVTYSNGCSGTDDFVVNVRTRAPADAGSDISLCYGTVAHLNATGGIFYLWSPATSLSSTNISNPISDPVSTITYTVTVTDITGCTGTDDVTVKLLSPLDFHLSADDISVCPGDIVQLSVDLFGSGAAPYMVYTSNGNIVTPPVNVLPSSTGLQYLFVKDGCGDIVRDSVLITVNPNPNPAFVSNIHEGCEPLTVSFNPLSSLPGQTYNWNFGDLSDNAVSFNMTPTHEYVKDGIYNVKLTVTSPFGCDSTKIFADMINVFNTPEARFLANPNIVSIVKPQIIFANLSEFAFTYLWSFGDGDSSSIKNPMHWYQMLGDYNVKLIAISDKGCRDTVNSLITVRDEYTFYTPNAITPDGDGSNDIFYVLGNNISEKNFHLYILDRWGGVVFETDKYDKLQPAKYGWDGSIKTGEIISNGSYSWFVKYLDGDNIEHDKSGVVNVIR